VTTVTDKSYLDPNGYWGDPSGNIRRMSGEQEIIATITPECSEAEWKPSALRHMRTTGSHYPVDLVSKSIQIVFSQF
jgi:hypothetical protein